MEAALSPEKVDVMYGNLESPVAPLICENGKQSGRQSDSCALDSDLNSGFTKYGADYIFLMEEGFSNTPLLNASPSLLQGIQGVFDVLSTANNHAMDRHSAGVDETIEQLERHGFSKRFTGTKKSNGEGQWHAEITSKGVDLAFIACTMHTNFINEKSKQVMKCYKDSYKNRQSGNPNPYLLEEISRLSQNYDAVIVTPHWGDEYTAQIDSKRQKLALSFFKQGALAVLGAHPHVIQPWEKYENFSDRFGVEKDRFVIYSLGNFMANQGGGSSSLADVKKRTGIVLYLGLTKNTQGTFINGVRFFPYYMSTSKVGPNKQRTLLGFEDDYVLNNQALNNQVINKQEGIQSHIKQAQNYIRSVLPLENKVLSAQAPLDTRAYFSQGGLQLCDY